MVLDALEAPGALAGASMERKHEVGEQVVAMAVDAVEIERGGAGGGEDDAVLRVDRDAGPRVGAADQRMGVRRPGVVGEFAGLRDRMEDPPEFAAVHVERPDVTRRS